MIYEISIVKNGQKCGAIMMNNDHFQLNSSEIIKMPRCRAEVCLPQGLSTFWTKSSAFAQNYYWSRHHLIMNCDRLDTQNQGFGVLKCRGEMGLRQVDC